MRLRRPDARLLEFVQKRFSTRCTNNPFLQRLSKQSRLSLSERMDSLSGPQDRAPIPAVDLCPGGEEAADAVVPGSAIDIIKVVGFDIERLKRHTTLLRPSLQERIKNRFPGACVDARGFGQHAVEIEDRGVEEAPAYP